MQMPAKLRKQNTKQTYLFLSLHPLVWWGRVFTNGLGDWSSIPGRVIPKTLKMVLDTSLLNTQHYKGTSSKAGEKNGFVQSTCASSAKQ